MLNQARAAPREATRLTQAANLPKPPRSSNGCSGARERAPEATTRTPGRISLTGREPPTIDAKANDIEHAHRAGPAGPASPILCAT